MSTMFNNVLYNVFFVCVLAVAGILLYRGAEGASDLVTPYCERTSTQEAGREALMQAIEDLMHNPASARFGTIELVPDSPCTWTVQSYFEGTNGYGAMRRTRYAAKITAHEKTEKWEIVELTWLEARNKRYY